MNHTICASQMQEEIKNIYNKEKERQRFMKKCGVYMITNKLTGEAYVGHTTDIDHRGSYYLGRFRHATWTYPSFVDAFREDENNIGWEILDICKIDELKNFEDFWIKLIKHGEFTLVNQRGASSTPFNSPEGRARKSLAQRGQKNGNAKLTEQDISEIKRLFAEGMQPKEIKKLFPVSIGHIYCIINGKCWRGSGC